MKKIMMGFGIMLALAGAAQAQPAKPADPFAQQRADWNKPFKPFHVIGNIYYVGMAGVSAFLIVTPKGDILTDGGLPESAAMIQKNIRALGFKLSDVKILLNSHAHFDHAGGLAALKKATGAKLYASAADRPILEAGRISFGPSTVDPFPPVRVDHAVKDGESLSLGGVTLTAHITPGHTPGCTNWSMPLTEAGVRHSVLFFCSITVGGNPLVDNKAYPSIADDFKTSFAKLDGMNADIFLAPHGGQFRLDEKVARMKPGAPNPFIDAGEFHRFVGNMKKAYDAELARQFANRRRYEAP